MKGLLIKDPMQIAKLADQGKAVWNNNLGKAQPAAFVQNYNFKQLVTMVKNKVYYTFLPKEKKNAKV